MDFNISHESVRKALRNGECLYWLNEELELSEYYDYDAQWIRKEGKWIFRLELFDIINNMQVACLISEKETTKIIYDFIYISILLKHRKAIITDLKEDYEEVIRKLSSRETISLVNLFAIVKFAFKPNNAREIFLFEINCFIFS